jgi:hypothetical protein
MASNEQLWIIHKNKGTENRITQRKILFSHNKLIRATMAGQSAEITDKR